MEIHYEAPSGRTYRYEVIKVTEYEYVTERFDDGTECRFDKSKMKHDDRTKVV